MKTKFRLLIFSLMITTVILFSYAYHQTFPLDEEEKANVTKVIDGDTIEVNIQGTSAKVRLLDINTPEKNQPSYEEAKAFLKNKIEGKEVLLEKGKENKDKYGRLLRYVFLGDEFMNELLLKEGFANFYSYQNSRYSKKLKEAEQQARREEREIWEKSIHPCSLCLVLSGIETGGEDDCQPGKESVTLENQCPFSCNLDQWTLKDAASHRYTFQEVIVREDQRLKVYNGQGKDQKTVEEIILFFQNKDKCASIWNDDQDALFLRDEKGKLVLYDHYE